MDSSGEALRLIVRFHRQVDQALILAKHHAVAKTDLTVQNDTVRRSQQLTLYLLVHRRADCILALDSRGFVRVDQKVTANHGWVIVPALKVVDTLSVYRTESERCCAVVHLVLPYDLELLVLHQLLILQHTNN